MIRANNRIHDYSTEFEVAQARLMISASKTAHEILEELTCDGNGTQTNGDELPHGGEEPYDETITSVNNVMVLGDSLSRVCWGSNAMNNRAYYIADTGHVVTVKPKEGEDSGASTRVQKFLEQWFKENDWKSRQSEVSQRLDRHGEVFDTIVYDDDGILRLNFAEPTDLDDDPVSKYQYQSGADPKSDKNPFVDLLGVRRTNDLKYHPVAYFIDQSWYPDIRVATPMGQLPPFADDEDLQSGERTLIQHRKRNCMANDPRGLTIYWPVREELIWAKKLLSNLMRTSGFQAAFGAIRTIMAGAGADQVGGWLRSQQTGGGSSGQNETYDFPSPAVVTVPSTIKYEFPETGQGATNHIEVLVSLLRACSSGLRCPEFMLTANVSEGNFASTLVSEGPFHKGMTFEQHLMVREDERILEQAVRYAASKAVMDLQDGDWDAVTVEIKPPRVQTRNRKEDHDVNADLFDRGLLDGKAWLSTENRDWESTQAQRKAELAAELELPAGSSLAKQQTDPGPITKPKTDPMAEKGVSKVNSKTRK